MGAVSNHFICIHVALRARSCLPYHQWKLIIQFAGYNLVTHFCDHVFFIRSQNSQFMVGHGRSFFQIAKGVYNFFGHACLGANFKIVARAFSLCAPILIGGYLHLAHGIFFNAEAHSVSIN